jgi:two-component system, cell cycle sensor histidine kinase and response regulator CckA
VTEQRSAEAEVRKLSAAVTHSPDLVVITNPEGTIEYVNPAFEKVTGFCRSEAVGRTPAIVKSGLQDAAFYRRLWDTVQSGTVFQGRFVNRRKDGTTFHVLQTIAPVWDQGEAIRYYVASGKEITEQVELEKRLREARKQEAIGQLAAGIAHDFNNLLTVVAGNVDLVRDELPSEASELKEDLLQALDATRQASVLTQQLLAVGRRQVSRPRTVNLIPVLEEFRTTAGELTCEGVNVVVTSEVDCAWISVDPDQLHQILLNLTTNARDAMPDGGTLSMSISRRIVERSPEEEAVLGMETMGSRRVQPGPWIVLEVADTGVGMDTKTLSRIFDPFFTTKPMDRGRGLGLATVYGIVAQSNGFIEVQSSPGDGSWFQIFLPETRPEDGDCQ